MDTYSIGKTIAALRKKNKMTQSALAEQLGVSDKAVSKWENGINQPDIQTLRSICAVFGISTEDFFRIASGETVDKVLSAKESSLVEPITFPI